MFVMTQMNSNKTNVANTTNSSKYAEDWLPIKSINNGMILTTDGYYVTGVKVSPKNIFIFDEQAQNATLFSLSTFYNTLDFEFWLLISDRPVDIDMYLSELQVLYNQTQDQCIRKLVMQDINKANMFMSREYNVVDTEYTFLFKEKKMELVQKKLNTLISGLANAGLQSRQTSNADLRMLLDNYLNDGISTNFRAVI